MSRIAAVLAITASLASGVLAQANTSYVDYETEPQPDLTPQTVAIVNEGFPDCVNGPLSTNLVCNTTADFKARAAGLISALTLDELINLTGNTQYGVPRLGLPSYQVWNEALHGLDRANFTTAGEFEWATSFPMPILSMASMNRTLINQIASIISTQARAFNNFGRYGLDSYAPNINGFRSPIWGRGQETPGEDAFLLSSAYAYEYITGLQGGVDPETLKIVATPKHFAGYDIENFDNHSRLGNDVAITQQDLANYYTPQFKAAVQYAKAQSLMCSYNAVNGVPSCANSFFLQTLLRNTWGFDADSAYVSTDCDAAYNVFNPHMYALNQSSAAADSVRAGADIDCGTTYQYYLNESIIDGYISRGDIEVGVSRLYTQLVRLGYFDGNASMYRDLTWNDVVTTDAWNISYEAAVEGITVLKNDGTLPLSKSVKSIALIGPWANATDQMQGNYYGTPPYLTSPLDAALASGLTINYAFGTNISSSSTSGFAAALAAANKSDAIIFAGGIDNTVEAEGMDRQNISWPGNQLSLIAQLADLGKPVIVLQMGGGQIDSSSLKSNDKVNALVWGGYPGQSGGQAILDILTGVRAPAGRLTSTQYPASYVDSFDQLDLSLRPNASVGNPGQTYIWYTGTPVYAFGTGLVYTTFSVTPTTTTSTTSNSTTEDGCVTNGTSIDIASIVGAAHPNYEFIEQQPLLNFTVNVANTGTVESDYSALLFASTSNAGPAPYPNKWLVGFDRIGPIAAGQSTTMTIAVPIGAMARADEFGNGVLYPGTYKLALNNEEDVVVMVTLTGTESVLTEWPREEQEIPNASPVVTYA